MQTLKQVELAVEKILREQVIVPLSQKAFIRASVNNDYTCFASDIVIEAKLWNIVRIIAERRLRHCQAKAQTDRVLYVA